jgi:excisionase family DNA binding protein
MMDKKPKNVNGLPNETQRIKHPFAVPRLMTIKQASGYLGLTVWALRERIWRGQIPFVKFDGGRKTYLCIDDLESFIEKHRQTEREIY